MDKNYEWFLLQVVIIPVYCNTMAVQWQKDKHDEHC